MKRITFKSKPLLKDEYVFRGILDFIGWSIFSFIAISMNRDLMFVSIALFLYFGYTSFALAYLRSNILIDLNSINHRAIRTLEVILNTEIMIEETDRRLYKRRLALLQMHMANLGEVYQNLEKSLEVFTDMTPPTMKKTTVLVKEAVQLKDTKFFLEKDNE